MNISTIRKAFIIIVLAILPISMIAQNKNKAEKVKPINYLYFDVDGGGTVSFGDNKPYQFNKMKMQGRIGIGFNFVGCLSVYGKIGYGALAGDYNDYFSGKSNYLSYNANFAVDLINLIGGYKEGRVFGLKLHGGVGQIQFRSEATKSNGTEYRFGYSDCEGNAKGKGFGGRKVAFEVPMGVELNFNVSRIIDIYADITTSYTDTDRLDGFPSGKHKDWYATGNVGVRFRIIKKQPKPVEVVEEEPVVKEEPVKPIAEPVKEVDPKPVVVKEPVYTESTFTIDFSQNNSEIGEKVCKLLSDFINNKIGNSRITSIKIVGYASPEGKDDFNRSIAIERANVAKEYLIQELGSRADGVKFDVSSIGADWDGFIKAVWNSNIKEKDVIIGKLSVSSYKAGTLWKLTPEYPKIKELYPALRRADVTITVVTE